MIARRSFLLGLGAAVCAPAIIRPGILMPVKKMLAIGDGVALQATAHPFSDIMAPRDLTEESLLELWMEIKRSWRPLVLRPQYIEPPSHP